MAVSMNPRVRAAPREHTNGSPKEFGERALQHGLHRPRSSPLDLPAVEVRSDVREDRARSVCRRSATLRSQPPQPTPPQRPLRAAAQTAGTSRNRIAPGVVPSKRIKQTVRQRRHAGQIEEHELQPLRRETGGPISGASGGGVGERRRRTPRRGEDGGLRLPDKRRDCSQQEGARKDAQAPARAEDAESNLQGRTLYVQGTLLAPLSFPRHLLGAPFSRFGQFFRLDRFRDNAQGR